MKLLQLQEKFSDPVIKRNTNDFYRNYSIL